MQFPKWDINHRQSGAIGFFYICFAGCVALGLFVWALQVAYNHKIELLREERNYFYVQMQGSALAANLIAKIHQIDDLRAQIARYDFDTKASRQVPGEVLTVSLHWTFHLKNSDEAMLSLEKRKAIEQTLLDGDYGFRGNIPVKIDTVKWNEAGTKIDVTLSWAPNIKRIATNSPETRVSLKDLLE